MSSDKESLKYDYYLKWKDTPVLKFNVNKASVELLDVDRLPVLLRGMPTSFDMVNKFCYDRVLMYNRKYCKEVLTSCGIDDQSSINICLISMALSFRDNYWICQVRDTRNWESVNLYKNKFSNKIARVSLTGEFEELILSDELFTGELTSKGTKAKCFYRKDGNLYLYKNETSREINAEILSFYIAKAIGISCSQYFYDKLFGKNCSVCQILTSEHYELIPYRDILSGYDDKAYEFVMKVDDTNFVLMQIFDYLTLNIDRNRDNFGLLKGNGEYVALYPLFDHDSCFKVREVNGIYFPTGMTCAETLKYLQHIPVFKRINVEGIVKRIKSKEMQQLFNIYGFYDDYSGVVNRAEQLIGWEKKG